ncbi:unnamed protein product, partial [Prorocentrum cordatum]
MASVLACASAFFFFFCFFFPASWIKASISLAVSTQPASIASQSSRGALASKSRAQTVPQPLPVGGGACRLLLPFTETLHLLWTHISANADKAMFEKYGLEPGGIILAEEKHMPVYAELQAGLGAAARDLR